MWMMLPWLLDGIWMWILSSLVGIVGFVVYTLVSSSGSDFSDNSIDAFIIQEGSKSKKENVDQSMDNRHLRSYGTEGKQVLILYGTEYGFSEEVATVLFDKISSIVQSDDVGPLQPRLVNCKLYECVELSREQICFVVISTSGDGVPPTDARGFYDNLMSCDEELSHLRFSVLALGDSNYPHFCKTGRDVNTRLSKRRADPVVGCQDVDVEDWAVINCWMDSVVEYLKSCDLCVCMDYLQITADQSSEGHDRHNPFMAVLQVKDLLTDAQQCNDDKEVVHCEFNISGSHMTWTSGDALGIYPENNPDHVSAILDTLTWRETEMFPVPNGAYHPHNDTASIRTLLLKYYDIKTIKPELLQTLQTVVTNTNQRETLSRLLQAGTGKSNKALQEYVAVREVRDVLQEYKPAVLSPRQLLPCLKPLQPRYYSISSSPLKASTAVCVTVAVLRYKTLSVGREGVTTSHLLDRTQVGQSSPVFMSRNPDFRLPDKHTTPVILIGPGTGIAPFRAFIQERELSPDKGEIHLYFGCRHKSGDFLYKEELEKYSRDGLICLRVAFSRDQARKVYVQDLLREDRAKVWDLVTKRNGHLYVCGDARHMAKDVHQGLTDIVQSCGQLERLEANEYLRQLEIQGRYQKDVWVT
ncbi:NADPH oxidoreductase A-like isoform X2 [Mizuhopecten yessoensis]|uniref:NADPH oxidoreductase A n=1 Tax=Mizuhopecten yessoensis TaxID=6573 RepID=A0A210PZ33_MIZYE|nr:NADPH oxidoreductase A-like isoform X2 [Mizuhopecten yessoensis]OWF41745.1 NADPH oxidoreductase A [Mizuhopecten yessoensis]